MKIRSLIYFLLFFVSIVQAQRQSVLKTAEKLSGYEKIPQEKIFIHYNTTLLFTGEYLYYKLYCFNSQHNFLSSVISKIAYVELIGEKGDIVFKQKIKLENGVGQGDFFLPVSIPSGNYKLIGYTQWMLNAKNYFFFQGDISILNPYQENQKAILYDHNLNDSIVSQKHTITDPTKLAKVEVNDNSNLRLRLDKQDFLKRSPVILTIDKLGLNGEPGNYSVSVRKKNSLISAESITAHDFSALDSKHLSNQKKRINSSIFLPEMRGELLYGKVIPKDVGFSVSSLDITLSVPGKTNDVKIVSTNKEGVFIFNLGKVYKGNEVVIQVLGENRNKYTIELNEIPEVNYPDFDFYKFKITKEWNDEIIKRSVYNQIENSFFIVKPDTIREVIDDISFYGTNFETYNLDEYTRFATVKETIVEIVDNVWAKKNEKGENMFGIRGFYATQETYNFRPLLIVDGIVEQEHEQIINYDARKIKSISYVRDRYFLGTKVFEGVLIFETLEGNYAESLHKDYLLKMPLSRPQIHKKYYAQQYDSTNKTYDDIPDFRNQLLWKPDVTLKDNNSTVIEFFTSDVEGDFEINLEGFKIDGTPVSIKKYFTVK